jgi:aconitate hydratase 2/2-methylisocitrate dehydratase
MEQIKVVNAKAAEIYRYMNFDQIPAFVHRTGGCSTLTVEM